MKKTHINKKNNIVTAGTKAKLRGQWTALIATQ